MGNDPLSECIKQTLNDDILIDDIDDDMLL